MLLAIDIGNTHVVLGLFDGAVLRASWRLQSDIERTVDEYALELIGLLNTSGIAQHEIHRIALCCVVPALSRVFVKLSRKYFKKSPLVVNSAVECGLTIDVDDPKTVGPDRIVNAVASRELVGAPNIVVDLGTATTFDVTDRDGRYIGGVIAPGLLISAQALFKRAAMLPSIELQRPTTVVGRNTRDAMISGIIYGYAGLIEGILARLQREQNAPVIATGGLANLVSEHAPSLKRVVPDLTLTGLRIIAGRVPDSKSTSSGGDSAVEDDDLE